MSGNFVSPPPEYWVRYDQGDLIGARQILEAQALKTFDPLLCFLLGQEFGVYAPQDLQDFSRAFYWFSAAASRGDASAIYEIGIAFLNRLGVAKDQESGIGHVRRAAEMGDDLALEFLLNERWK